MLALTASAPAPHCHRRHDPWPNRRRAFELFASCRDGCTEAIMLAHGFTLAQMVGQKLVYIHILIAPVCRERRGYGPKSRSTRLLPVRSRG